MKITKYALAIAMIALVAPNALRADTIFSNLGPGGTYNPEVAYGLGNLNPIAMPFTVAAGTGFALTQIDVALSSYGGAGIELVTDSGSGVPSGDVLRSWTFASLPILGTTNSILQTVTGISGITLAGGATYWLETASAPAFGFSWNLNTTSDIGTYVHSFDGGNTWLPAGPSALGAFDVIGTPVPEPSSLLLLGTGLLGLMGMGLYKKRLA